MQLFYVFKDNLGDFVTLLSYYCQINHSIKHFFFSDKNYGWNTEDKSCNLLPTVHISTHILNPGKTHPVRICGRNMVGQPSGDHFSSLLDEKKLSGDNIFQYFTYACIFLPYDWWRRQSSGIVALFKVCTFRTLLEYILCIQVQY